MTDNEKILQLLTEMRSDIADLKQGQARLEHDVTDMKQVQVAHGQKLDAHGQILDAHGQKIDSISQKLDDHGQILDAHSQKLDAYGQKLDSHGQILDAHGQKIDSLSQIVVLMENDHGLKLKALLDGYHLNEGILKRVESDVAEIRSDVSDLHVRLFHQERTVEELRKAN